RFLKVEAGEGSRCAGGCFRGGRQDGCAAGCRLQLLLQALLFAGQSSEPRLELCEPARFGLNLTAHPKQASWRLGDQRVSGDENQQPKPPGKSCEAPFLAVRTGSGHLRKCSAAYDDRRLE